MKKLIVALIVLVIAAFSLVFVFKREALDFFFQFVDTPEVIEDTSFWEKKIIHFEGGTSEADRDFLLRKLLAFSAASEETHFAKLAYKYYFADFEKIAADGRLDAKENRTLRELYQEVLSEEQVDTWYKERGTLIIGD